MIGEKTYNRIELLVKEGRVDLDDDNNIIVKGLRGKVQKHIMHNKTKSVMIRAKSGENSSIIAIKHFIAYFNFTKYECLNCHVHTDNEDNPTFENVSLQVSKDASMLAKEEHKLGIYRHDKPIGGNYEAYVYLKDKAYYLGMFDLAASAVTIHCNAIKYKPFLTKCLELGVDNFYIRTFLKSLNTSMLVEVDLDSMRNAAKQMSTNCGVDITKLFAAAFKCAKINKSCNDKLFKKAIAIAKKEDSDGNSLCEE